MSGKAHSSLYKGNCIVVGLGVVKKERMAWFNWFIICNNSCCWEFEKKTGVQQLLW